MSASDDARRLADRITELERALEASEREVEKLACDNNEACDRIYSLQCAAIVGGLNVQAKNALLLVQRYLDEGDDFGSQRVRDALLEAIAVTAKAAEIQAASEAA